MVALYMISWGEAAGKTALCVGTGQYLQDKGKKVAYLKPLSVVPQSIGGIDEDSQFVKQALELEEPKGTLCLNLVPGQTLKARLAEDDFYHPLRQAYNQVAQDVDVVLVEGLGGLGQDLDMALASQQIVEILDAKVILVVRYSPPLPWAMIASTCERFGKHLLGIVINQVPKAGIESASRGMISLFGREGIEVLGVLPEERKLLTVSIAELAEHLEAAILCCAEASSELVENVMLGALCVDSGADYFERKAGKVVVTRGERPDIQLAALATSTKCLVLTGNVPPLPQVLYWAQDKGVPILLAKQDTLAVEEKIEQALVESRFRQPKKLNPLKEILGQYFDFATLYHGLGLAN